MHLLPIPIPWLILLLFPWESHGTHGIPVFPIPMHTSTPIQAHHIFQPVAVESLGPISASGRVFLSILGRKLADQSGDDREISFLFQRLSVLIQLYNAILLHGCFVKEEEE